MWANGLSTVETHSYILLKVTPLSSGPVPTTQEGEEVAGKESVELQKEVVDSHVEVKVQRLWSQLCRHRVL